MTGETFGYLTVLHRHHGIHWVCRCQCGREKRIRSDSLKSGRTKSCGCMRGKIGGRKRSKHGRHQSSEYSSWEHMIGRCCNPNDTNFHNYGGRGIAVCRQWRGERGFQQFIDDLGEKPSPEHTIDRIDVDGDYSPENCKWSTRSQQSRNTRRTRFLEFQGQRLCVQDWADWAGLNRNTLTKRLNSGWSVEDALTTPVGGAYVGS